MVREGRLLMTAFEVWRVIQFLDTPVRLWPNLLYQLMGLKFFNISGTKSGIFHYLCQKWVCCVTQIMKYHFKINRPFFTNCVTRQVTCLVTTVKPSQALESKRMRFANWLAVFERITHAYLARY